MGVVAAEITFTDEVMFQVSCVSPETTATSSWQENINKLRISPDLTIVGNIWDSVSAQLSKKKSF